ncbi:MAG TPA: DinB family protein [bacterium]|nr:DinB family protein [bacterium]
MTEPGRPAADEYADYYGRYIDRVPERPVLETLERQIQDTMTLLRAVPEPRGNHRYAPEKWSLKEVLGHVTDVERIFSTRALHFAREEKQSLPGMDQDQYVTAAGFDRRSLAGILDELEAVRRASLALFAGFDEAAWLNRGVASGYKFTARTIPWILAGHELHHVAVLQERYL